MVIYSYGEQLVIRRGILEDFVPDSPTAILYLVISISLILIQKQNSIIEALAFVTLNMELAIIMNILFIIEQGDITVNRFVLTPQYNGCSGNLLLS
ncbi:DUF1405 domain-containing protein [Staphylococcus aureus]